MNATMKDMFSGVFSGVAMLALLSVSTSAQATTDSGTIEPADVARFFNQRGYSPDSGRSFPVRPLCGGIHLHTSWSPDAVAVGTRLGPDEALWFAQVEEPTSNTGQSVRLSRPHDCMMLADLSDAPGVVSGVVEGNSSPMADLELKEWHEGISAGGDPAHFEAADFPPETTMTDTEHATPSPIWYAPE